MGTEKGQDAEVSRLHAGVKGLGERDTADFSGRSDWTRGKGLQYPWEVAFVEMSQKVSRCSHRFLVNSMAQA